jgi:hypothetical protein
MSDFPPPPVPLEAPPSPRRRWLPWTIAGGAVLIISIGIALMAPLLSKGIHAVGDSKRTLSAYLTALESEDVAAAEALLCDDLKEELTPAALTKELAAAREAQGPLRSFKIGDVMVKRNFGSDPSTTAEATYTLYFKDSSERHEALLVKADGQWKVCGFR